MGTKTNLNGGDTAAMNLPTTAKSVVATVKEIVTNCTEQEIYAALKDCDMDPNLAVENLLSQDTFREVRSKREKRKEMKEASDSRTRGNSVGFSRSGKIGFGIDPGVVQSGFPNVAYKEIGKAVDKQEVGSVCALVTSSATHYVPKSSKVDSLNTDNGRQSLRTGVSMSDTAQVSPGHQPWSVVVSKGQLSMADIVRMGRPSQDDVSHNHCNSLGFSSSGNSESSLSLPCQSNSEQQGIHDEWPVIEQPITGNAEARNTSSSSDANGPHEHSNLHVTEVNLHRNCELDAAQVSPEEFASDNAISEKNESSFMSNNTGLGSHSNSNLENTPTSDFCSASEHHQEMSSVALDLQRLSMKESNPEGPSSEDSVVLPNHVQALAAECSHLSFGTYKGGNNSASSVILTPNNLSRSGMEMKSEAVDDSLPQFLDASSLNHGDEQFGFHGLKGTLGDQNKNYNSHSTPWHEYSTTSSISDPTSLQKSHWVTPLPLNQPGLQSENHSSFPGDLHNNSKSVPQDLLSFLLAQSQRARHINLEPSINNVPLSISEVMEPGTFARHNRSTPTQSFTVQPNKHFQQSPDMKAYQSLLQNQSYMTTIDSRRAFSDNPAYNRFPANMNYNNIPQNRKEFLMSKLSRSTAGDANGYGNLDPSSYYPGNYVSNPSVGNLKPSSNFNEILASQYNGGHNMSSIQTRDSFSQWDHGTKSRSSQYNFMDQPSHASISQYASPEYSDYYRSWSQVPEEQKQSGSVQDLLPRQLHQFWQHNH